MYLIKIKTHNGHGCWLRSFYGGDPFRILIRGSALKFADKDRAERKIEILRKQYCHRSFELEKY